MITQRMMHRVSESKDAILFTASAGGSNINFFRNASTSATPLSDYDVYINDTKTNQQYNSLTFTQGDVVKIKAKDGVNVYPVFYAGSQNYLLSIDAPFPRMVNASGDVQSFSGCFTTCSSLTSIPADLFKYNTAVTNFSFCFPSCSSLTSIPADLFKYNIAVETFTACFYGCTSVTSALPTLWESHSSATGIQCFYNCTNASNYSSVPSGWK